MTGTESPPIVFDSDDVDHVGDARWCVQQAYMASCEVATTQPRRAEQEEEHDADESG